MKLSSKLVILFFLLGSLQGCTLISTVAGPFFGIYAKAKTFVRDMDDSSLKVIEKVGIALALPVSLTAGAAEGMIVGPFVGFGADLEYISTGKIDLSRFKDRLEDATDKYKIQEDGKEKGKGKKREDLKKKGKEKGKD